MVFFRMTTNKIADAFAALRSAAQDMDTPALADVRSIVADCASPGVGGAQATVWSALGAMLDLATQDEVGPHGSAADLSARACPACGEVRGSDGRCPDEGCSARGRGLGRVRLAYCPDAARAFCGATGWANGDTPLFGDVFLRAPLEDDGVRYEAGHGALVLDSGGDPDAEVTTLTLNLSSEDGYAAAFVKTFPGQDRTAAKAWAENRLWVSTDAVELQANRMRFVTY